MAVGILDCRVKVRRHFLKGSDITDTDPELIKFLSPICLFQNSYTFSELSNIRGCYEIMERIIFKFEE